jgi:CheY-like chemotaxis protein
MTLTPQNILDARILIVDDQLANVSLLEDMLETAGYTDVTSTTDPTEVCALNRQTPFDLILLDLQMPVMDGFEVMEGLKASHTDDYLPVLVITAQPGHKVRALQSGAKDFVSKPFDLLEVKTRIHNLLLVRLLYQQLANYNTELEQKVLERTAELRDSEARYKALTELSTDWHWEQNQAGEFIRVTGPVLEILGLTVDAKVLESAVEATHPDSDASPTDQHGWNIAERADLQARISSRNPFLDVLLTRTLPTGGTQQYRVSGTPLLDAQCTFLGYRGYGVEVMSVG